MCCCRVTNCCGCNSLRTGCIRLGITNIVFACLELISLAGGVNVYGTVTWAIVSIAVNAALIYGAQYVDVRMFGSYSV